MKIITLLITLFFVVNAYAVIIARGKTLANPTLQFEETFEGALNCNGDGCDNASWVTDATYGTIDYDYTNISIEACEGDCLLLDSTSNNDITAESPPFGSPANITETCFNLSFPAYNSPTAPLSIFKLYLVGGGSVLVHLFILEDETFRLKSGNVSGDGSFDNNACSLGDCWIWIRHEKGSGASDEKVRLFVSINNTRPASPDITFDNGDAATGQGSFLWWRVYFSGIDMTIDNVQVANEAIPTCGF